jgi:hypothetical protein
MPPVIRPFNPPVLPAATPRSTAAPDVRAAQRAFFQQAMGDTTPASAPAAAAPVARSAPSRAIEPAVTRVKTQPIPDEKPTRILRPGSFVDIKV